MTIKDRHTRKGPFTEEECLKIYEISGEITEMLERHEASIVIGISSMLDVILAAMAVRGLSKESVQAIFKDGVDSYDFFCEEAEEAKRERENGGTGDG